LARYKLDLVGVQEVRWDEGATIRSGGFLIEDETKIVTWEQNFFVHRIISAVKRVEIVSDRMPYTVMRGRWFNNIVLNIHATNEKKKAKLQKTAFMKN